MTSAETSPPQSFWKKYFCQPVDPLAGQWKHELLGRAGWMLLSCIGFSIIYPIARNYDLNDVYMFPILLSLLTGLPELLLRRSWKVGLLAVGFGVVASFLSVILDGPDSFTSNEQFKRLLLSLGITISLAAGLGARSLLCGILGLFTGVLTGWLANLILRMLDSAMDKPDNIVDNFIVVFLIVYPSLLPFVIIPGLTVCLGLRWSKRRASGTPGTV